jgi:hypothetical protein
MFKVYRKKHAKYKNLEELNYFIQICRHLKYSQTQVK